MNQRKIVLRLAFGSLIFLILIVIWVGYQRLVIRPANIQTQLFGKQISDINNLSTYEPETTFFGEGRERWIYALSPDQAKVLVNRCRNEFEETCDIATKDDPIRNIQYAIRLRRNELIVEVWYL